MQIRITSFLAFASCIGIFSTSASPVGSGDLVARAERRTSLIAAKDSPSKREDIATIIDEVIENLFNAAGGHKVRTMPVEDVFGVDQDRVIKRDAHWLAMADSVRSSLDVERYISGARL